MTEAPPPPPPLDPPTPPPPGQKAYDAAPQNGIGTAGFVLGILGLAFLCVYGGGLILSILAIIFGKMGLNKADQGLASNRSLANAGFIMGIIGTIIGVIIVVILLILFLLAIASNSAMG